MLVLSEDYDPIRDYRCLIVNPAIQLFVHVVCKSRFDCSLEVGTRQVVKGLELPQIVENGRAPQKHSVNGTHGVEEQANDSGFLKHVDRVVERIYHVVS